MNHTDPAPDLPSYVIGEIRAHLGRMGHGSRTQLTDTMDVSPDWLARRLSGTVGVTLHDVQMIADGLGVDVRTLLP